MAASAQYAVLTGGSCALLADAAPNQATGTITIKAVNTNEATGSFDVKFSQPSIHGQEPKADHLAGQFAAPACSPAFSGTGPLKCQLFASQ